MLCGVFISEMCLFDFNELSSVSYGGVGLDFVVLMVVVVVFLVCCVSVWYCVLSVLYFVSCSIYSVRNSIISVVMRFVYEIS